MKKVQSTLFLGGYSFQFNCFGDSLMTDFASLHLTLIFPNTPLISRPSPPFMLHTSTEHFERTDRSKVETVPDYRSLQFGTDQYDVILIEEQNAIPSPGTGLFKA